LIKIGWTPPDGETYFRFCEQRVGNNSFFLDIFSPCFTHPLEGITPKRPRLSLLNRKADGGQANIWWKTLDKEHPKIYLQASETPKTGAHARNPGKGKEKRRKWKRKIDSHLVIFFCLFWRALD
jgi:hypothetical protein